MGDFVAETALEEVGERKYRVVLSTEWMTWGPAGGYMAALALRAAGAATRFDRPASFVCQFLSVARFEAVDIEVEVLRGGRRSEALRVMMTQEGSPVLSATVWALSGDAGMEHDYTTAPDVPGHEDLRDVRELMPDRPQLGMYKNFDRRPTEWTGPDDREPRPPVTRAWIRFSPNPTAEERFVDAARSVARRGYPSAASTARSTSAPSGAEDQAEADQRRAVDEPGVDRLDSPTARLHVMDKPLIPHFLLPERGFMA